MKRISLLFFAVVFSVCSLSSLIAEERPNFIVFLTDDMGWGDLACYGHPIIQTPNLDQFAKEGVRFTQAYSSCGVCSPSRSSILTGRTPYRNGVWRWIPGGHQTHLRESEITLPELLKPLGYQTLHTGKWHLNGHFNSPEQPQPNDHGYDWWFATQNNAAPNHKNPVNFVRNGEKVGPLEGFSAPLVVEEAIQWLNAERDSEKPFFMTVWTHEPHLPIESDPKFMKLYSELEDPDLRQHHGNITQIDYAFGNLMKTLKEKGLEENTFVIFTSDNGPEGRSDKGGRTRGSTGGLRGRKRDSHEGGIRVPAIVRWPGKIKADTVSEVPVIGSDIFSTVLDIAEVPLPDDRTIDGVSMIPALAGEKLDRPIPLFWRTHIAPEASHAAMRIDEWKIVANKNLTEFQLYQIEEDWQEKSNLAESKPEKLAEMKAKFLEVWKDVEEEGPSDWWKNEPARKPKKKSTGKLSVGTDKTGDWDVVKGGTVEKSEFGYRLDAGPDEAFALKKLDTQVQESATFTLRYRASDATSKTKNACFCFGSRAENDSLFKAGTMIGMDRHGIFEGGWGNVGSGIGRAAKFDHGATFDATITIDLEHGKAILVIGDTKVVHKLPDSLESITHVGIYAKATTSEFTMPEMKE